VVIGNDEAGAGSSGHLFLARRLRQARECAAEACQANFRCNCPLPAARTQAYEIFMRQSG
jgi:hypothetical protein